MARCFYCLGNHETSQCMSRATDRIMRNRNESTEAIERAIERAGYRLTEQLQGVEGDLVDGLYHIQEAISMLHDFLSWAHQEVIWRMERQIEILTGIHDMIKNPRATQADELYKMGVESFKRNRLQDAIKSLKDARKLNPGDYRVHITLGHIFVQIDSIPKALECFRAATDYARSVNYKKDALLLTSRALRCVDNIDDAIKIAREAVAIKPDDSSANYELATCIGEKVNTADSF